MACIRVRTLLRDSRLYFTLAYSADRGSSFKYEYDHLNQLTAVYDDTGTDRSTALGPRS